MSNSCVRQLFTAVVAAVCIHSSVAQTWNTVADGTNCSGLIIFLIGHQVDLPSDTNNC